MAEVVGKFIFGGVPGLWKGVLDKFHIHFNRIYIVWMNLGLVSTLLDESLLVDK